MQTPTQRPLSDTSVEALAAVADRFEDDPSVLKAIARELEQRGGEGDAALLKSLRQRLHGHEQVAELRAMIGRIDDGERYRVLAEEFQIAEQILITAQARERSWRSTYAVAQGDQLVLRGLDARGTRRVRITDDVAGDPDVAPNSPIGRLLLGREVGDVVHVAFGQARIPMRIVEIRKPDTRRLSWDGD